MSKCYLEDSIRTHAHVGPFERCSVCGKTICSECIARHLPSGAIWCVRCASVSIGDDRLARFTYDSGRLVYTAPPPRRGPRSITHGIASTLSASGHLILRASRGLVAPFRRTDRQSPGRNDFGLNLTLSTLDDKVQYGAMLAAVIVAVVLGGLIYANLNGIPPQQVILVIALTCASWAIVSVYLRFVFDNPLGRTASQIISYIIASFVAFLIGSWLINWTWLGRIFGG